MYRRAKLQELGFKRRRIFYILVLKSIFQISQWADLQWKYRRHAVEIFKYQRPAPVNVTVNQQPMGEC